MIFYFSGTGNTRYCAETLGKMLGDELVDVSVYIRQKKAGHFHSSRPWIFCSPIYIGYLPKIFAKFIRASTFEGDPRFYFIITLGGNEKGGSIAPKLLPGLCRLKGKHYMGAGHITMPRNLILFFNLQDEAEIQQQLQKADSLLAQYGKLIQKEQTLPVFPVNTLEYIMILPILNAYYKHFVRDEKFTVDETCIGCGLCARVCPLGNITMEGRKPRWNGNCTHCTACINRCPKAAIQYGRGTRKRGRYTLEKYRAAMKKS